MGHAEIGDQQRLAARPLDRRGELTTGDGQVRWWHSWCRVRSLGLRTSRPTRYTAQPAVERTTTGMDEYGNVPS
jgi:hypothetical protein